MIKAGVIGAGSMGKNHARIYVDLFDTELVAAADPDIQKLELLQQSKAIQKYADYRQMLKNEELDIISIAAPSSLHYEIARDVLDYGAHVLVEKPITTRLKEAEELIRLADDRKLKLMVGHVFRYNPAIAALKTKLENDALGKIYQITSQRVGPFPDRVKDVGVVTDLVTHDVDIMCYLLNEKPTRVYAEYHNQLKSSFVDLINGMLRFPSGAIGTLDINWLNPVKKRILTILGEKGAFLVEQISQDLFFYEIPNRINVNWEAFHETIGVKPGSMQRFSIEHYEPLRAEIEAFVHAVKDDLPVPISGQEGLLALKIALALKESGNKNFPLELE